MIGGGVADRQTLHVPHMIGSEMSEAISSKTGKQLSWLPSWLEIYWTIFLGAALFDSLRAKCLEKQAVVQRLLKTNKFGLAKFRQPTESTRHVPEEVTKVYAK